MARSKPGSILAIFDRLKAGGMPRPNVEGVDLEEEEDEEINTHKSSHKKVKIPNSPY